MSKSDSWESDCLKLLFNATAMANVADNAATSPITNLFVSLHTADPGETGTQSTNETTYTNYARVAVARTSGGWTISGTAPTQAANAVAVTFPQCGATGATLTHFGVGTLTSGAGKLLYSAALTSSLAVSNGITPSFAIGALVVTED
jgi:hypothetical protein